MQVIDSCSVYVQHFDISLSLRELRPLRSNWRGLVMGHLGVPPTDVKSTICEDLLYGCFSKKALSRMSFLTLPVGHMGVRCVIFEWLCWKCGFQIVTYFSSGESQAAAVHICVPRWSWRRSVEDGQRVWSSAVAGVLRKLRFRLLSKACCDDRPEEDKPAHLWQNCKSQNLFVDKTSAVLIMFIRHIGQKKMHISD